MVYIIFPGVFIVIRGSVADRTLTRSPDPHQARARQDEKTGTVLGTAAYIPDCPNQSNNVPLDTEAIFKAVACVCPDRLAVLVDRIAQNGSPPAPTYRLCLGDLPRSSPFAMVLVQKKELH